MAKNRNILVALLLITLSSGMFAQESKIRDLVQIRGIRSNQLVGVGLVVGLNNTGDSSKSILTNRAATALLSKMGVTASEQDVTGGGRALVVATAELPPYSRSGDRFDLKISALGDAKSLAGGTLILTHLRAGDGQIYAVGQGSVSIGQANGTGSQVFTVATVPNGAVVEREFSPEVGRNGYILLSLKVPDFTTNKRIAESINEHFRGFYATSTDVAGVSVSIPPSFQKRVVEFISEIENITVTVEQKAIIAINERTGTIVMGGDIVVLPVTISHGELAITIGAQKQGQKPKVQRVVNFGGTTVNKLVESMTAMGMKPADLVSVLQALKNAGALNGELKIL